MHLLNLFSGCCPRELLLQDNFTPHRQKKAPAATEDTAHCCATERESRKTPKFQDLNDLKMELFLTKSRRAIKAQPPPERRQ